MQPVSATNIQLWDLAYHINFKAICYLALPKTNVFQQTTPYLNCCGGYTD